MAKKRDIIIAAVIAASLFVFIVFFILIIFGAYYSGDSIALGGRGGRIAVIDVIGVIYDSDSVVRQLKKWGESGSIKALVLHIDSPGGLVAPAQEIYSEMKRIRDEEGKIVVVSMSSVAASGGYLISCGADRIMANPGTLTGSIGVIMRFPTAGKLLDKIGIKYERVKSGELKDVGSFDRNMTPEEREMLSAMIMDTYEQFVDVVTQERHIPRDEVYLLADGSVFSGRQAYELGLVDTLGGFEDAVRLAADMAGISGEPRVVREWKPKSSIWDLLGSILGDVNQRLTEDFCGPEIMYLY
jgi:protease-4